MTKAKIIYQAKNLPVLQNRTYANKSEAQHCTCGNITLVQSPTTGIVFNQDFDLGIIHYDENYQNEQANSLRFQNHLTEVSHVIHSHFNKNTLIEVGCGKGYFLERLQKQGLKITGIDPAYEGTNPNIIKEKFTPNINYHADGIILRHVLEHIQNPVEFLANIRNANNNQGRIYIEVPCFDWIRNNNAWFDIFYEHVNYFSIRDFRRIFTTIIESGHLFGGQYIYIVADLKNLRLPPYHFTDDVTLPANFLASVNTSDLTSPSNKDQTTVIWGAASKGVIFSLFMARAGITIDMVVDINPEKQNTYLPVTGHLVYAPEEAQRRWNSSTVIFIMNSNYLDEIRAYTGNQFKYIAVDHENI